MSPPTADIHAAEGDALRGCHCCGLVQWAAPPPPGRRVVCVRCGFELLSSGRAARSNHRTAALALAALILYIPAVMLPVLRIERMGHVRADSLVSGVATLLADGHLLVGGVVLVFSVIVPPLKLFTLLVLAAGGLGMGHHHRARTYRAIELIGRWGMLDVMLVAVLAAFVKLGDLVAIQPGPGLFAFAGCVLLSLAASMCFDPHHVTRD